ncbi:hypothetical protein R5R35_012214 [Gryllus longicercus]|uniref:Reticulon-like protein n=1 Tax=Gryllus longicercus TaxID=2509291 RepID=A0AAN9Z128_9ORTH
MENLSQQPAATGLRRENESMDDFEHLEAESTSPVKENSNDKLASKETKSDNLKSEKDSSSPLVKVPGESRNSSDFSLLSDSKLDSPVTDNSSVFTMEDTARKLQELTTTLEDRKSQAEEIPAETATSHIPELDMFSKFEPKTDSESVLQSFLASEKLGGVTDVLKEGSSNVDLLSFDSTPSAVDVGEKIPNIQGKHSTAFLKDDEDSFKDTMPEIIRTADKTATLPEEINHPSDADFAVMEDTFRDVIHEAVPDIKKTENVINEDISMPKYKSDHEEDEEFNLAASQDSSPIRMADKLEQYNIKPALDILSTDEPETNQDESLVIDGEKVALGSIAPTKEGNSEEKLQIPSKTVATRTKLESPIAVSPPLSLPLDSWFKPERLHPRVESLVYWRNPKVSGAVLGVGLALLLSLTYCSLISVIAYVSLAVLVGCGGFRLYRAVLAAVNKTGEGHPFRDLLDKDIAVSSDRAASLAQQIVPHINASVSELRRLFLVEDILDSFKFGVMVWALTYVGAIFNGLTLVILAFVSAFTLPRLYENNKQQIDKNLELARAKFAEINAKVQAFNPLSGAAAKKLAGSTAGSEDKKEN